MLTWFWEVFCPSLSPLPPLSSSPLSSWLDTSSESSFSSSFSSFFFAVADFRDLAKNREEKKRAKKSDNNTKLFSFPKITQWLHVSRPPSPFQPLPRLIKRQQSNWRIKIAHWVFTCLSWRRRRRTCLGPGEESLFWGGTYKKEAQHLPQCAKKISNLDGWSSGRGIREGSLSSCDDFALFFKKNKGGIYSWNSHTCFLPVTSIKRPLPLLAKFLSLSAWEFETKSTGIHQSMEERFDGLDETTEWSTSAPPSDVFAQYDTCHPTTDFLPLLYRKVERSSSSNELAA